MEVRSIVKNIQNELFQGKIILIMGPRQVGKIYFIGKNN